MKHFWDRVRFYGATQSFTIGAMHMFLWNAPPRPDDADNPLRELQAVPMPSEIKEPFSQRFGVKIMGQGLSQSEAMLILRQDTRKRSDWPVGSCGNPVDGIDVMLADDAGNEVPVGEPGELWVRPQPAVRDLQRLLRRSRGDRERLFRRVVQDRRHAAPGRRGQLLLRRPQEGRGALQGPQYLDLRGGAGGAPPSGHRRLRGLRHSRPKS